MLPPRLQVELRVVPLTEQYWDRVVAHCISEIQQGRTPNPDVLCNSRCVAVPRQPAAGHALLRPPTPWRHTLLQLPCWLAGAA